MAVATRRAVKKFTLLGWTPEKPTQRAKYYDVLATEDWRAERAMEKAYPGMKFAALRGVRVENPRLTKGQVVQHFKEGAEFGASGSLAIIGNTLYSYDEPILRRLAGGRFETVGKGTNRTTIKTLEWIKTQLALVPVSGTASANPIGVEIPKRGKYIHERILDWEDLKAKHPEATIRTITADGHRVRVAYWGKKIRTRRGMRHEKSALVSILHPKRK